MTHHPAALPRAPANTEPTLAAEIADEEAEIRRIAQRDGIPAEWVETVLAKLRDQQASRA